MSRAIMQQALDALKYHTEHTYPFHLTNVAIEALQKALAQPEQEPVALKMVYGEVCCQSKHDDQSFGMWCPITEEDFPNGTRFYTSSPRKEWIGLREDEIKSECYLSEKDVEDVVNIWRKIVSEQDKTIQLMKTLEQTGKKFVRKKFTNLSHDDLSRICIDSYNISEREHLNNSEYIRHIALQIAIRLKELNT
jgi:hypothetical protein